MKLTVVAKDGYTFPYVLNDKKRKRHFEFTLRSDTVIKPEVLEKWREAIPQLEDLVLMKDPIWVLVRLKEGVRPQDFGVKYFHEVPEAIITWLPTT